ncbi:hypothetical protein BJV82DRAFT_668972 [Fennellomyces sp. T-0311]|nr:hypothetical protein BJV82DRAFT_668972 [Fennellomyces sp. T-0311]
MKCKEKQLRAIDAYNLGLQSVSEDDPGYTQLISDKEIAAKQKESRVDFISALPIEVVDDIYSLLPKDSKATCFSVSSVWRDRIFKCSSAWKTLTVDSVSDHEIARVIQHIAGHVENLALNTMDSNVFLWYLASMSKGDFGKIKSLQLDDTPRRINIATIMPLTNAFWRIHTTLTRLVLHLNQSGPVAPLIDLLSICSNLTSLEYSTTHQLSEVVGKVRGSIFYNTLVSMHLRAVSITCQDIQTLLPYCQQLRSLTLSGSNDVSILGVVDNICPNLCTFGYNPQINKMEQLDHKNVEWYIRGLRQFYTNNGGTPVDASAVLPLIRRNMHSLETLYINITLYESRENLVAVYPSLVLRRLKSLTFWGNNPESIQPLLLRSISMCTMLTHVAAVESRNISSLVNALEALPQLESLEPSYTKATTGEQDLVRLLEKYSRDRCSPRRLRTVRFRYCKANTVTDNVLATLANIDTVEKVWFAGLATVSERGLRTFFETSGRISDVRFTEMECWPFDIRSTRGLKDLHLEKLKVAVTEQRIADLVEQASGLQSLIIEKCRHVIQNPTRYTNGNVKSVQFIE